MVADSLPQLPKTIGDVISAKAYINANPYKYPDACFDRKTPPPFGSRLILEQIGLEFSMKFSPPFFPC